MAYEGKGDMVDFVTSWNVVLSALANPIVIQQQVMGTPASLTVFDDKIVLSFR